MRAALENTTPPTWRHMFFMWFVPCFFFALASLSLLFSLFIPVEKPENLQFELHFLASLAPANAALSGIACTLIILLLRKRLAAIAGAAALPRVIVVACIAGAAAPFILLPKVVLAASLLILVVVGKHISIFFGGLRTMLAPDYHLTWTVLGRLGLIYINLMAAFTVINLNLNVLSQFLPEMSQAFAFNDGPAVLVDAVYFSIVLMTTVGFGDLHPMSPLAKFVVSMECLVSYVMFALLVGLVVRGIDPDDTAAKHEKGPASH